MVIKWHNGRGGLRGREKFSNKISFEPRLEWGEASHGELEGKHVPGRGNSNAKAPRQERAWHGKGTELKLVCFDHE